MLKHLGSYSDLVEHLVAGGRRFGSINDLTILREKIREIFAFPEFLATLSMDDVKVEREWQADGICGCEYSWHVGYGPRTRGWLLRPAGCAGELPGVLALHDHGGFKFFGKEKIADSARIENDCLKQYRESYYGGRAYANALAREGFAVLVPDVFLWGSRKIDKANLPENEAGLGALLNQVWGVEQIDPEISSYNIACGFNEHTIAKYAQILHFSIAALISYEDRLAADLLGRLPGVKPDGIGCIGLSGGGVRSAMLQGTCDRIAACVIVGMMSTHRELLDCKVFNHSWMFYPTGLSGFGDWPDVPGCRAPSPLLVQYDLDDGLFTRKGMEAADKRLKELYAIGGNASNYSGEFYPGGHKFDLDMQKAAFAFLKKYL